MIQTQHCFHPTERRTIVHIKDLDQCVTDHRDKTCPCRHFRQERTGRGSSGDRAIYVIVAVLDDRNITVIVGIAGASKLAISVICGLCCKTGKVFARLVVALIAALLDRAKDLVKPFTHEVGVCQHLKDLLLREFWILVDIFACRVAILAAYRTSLVSSHFLKTGIVGSAITVDRRDRHEHDKRKKRKDIFKEEHLEKKVRKENKRFSALKNCELVESAFEGNG